MSVEIDLVNAKKRDYRVVFLKRNPFPSLTVPEENPRITADRKKAIERFVNAIRNLREEDESSIVVYVGDYGAGKSHLLRVFSVKVRDQLYDTKGGVFPIFIQTPGRNFLDFFIEVVEGIGIGLMTQLANNIIEKFMSENKDRARNYISSKNLKDIFEKGDYRLEELLEDIQVIDLFKNIRKSELKSLKESDFLNAFLNLSKKSTRSVSWNWLSGSTLTRDEKTSIMVTDLNDDARRARSFLKDLIKIIEMSGFKHVIFFLDEFEKITLMPSNLRKTFQDDLRDVIDEFPKKVAMFIAITPHAWKQLEKEPTALTRRLRPNQVELDKFGEQEIKELILKYLASEREENNAEKIKVKFKNCDPTLAPFANSAISYILDESQGIVSSILEKCRTSLEHFVDNPSEEINRNVVREALK